MQKPKLYTKLITVMLNQVLIKKYLTGWSKGNALNLYSVDARFESRAEPPAALTEAFLDFSSLQADAGVR
jgi:hypothetical protein